MKISYKWLQEYFDDKLPEPEKLEEAIVLKSFEVEEVTKNGDDEIFDIDILPNRAHDCLSHEGVAIEVSGVTGTKLNHSKLYSSQKNAVETYSDSDEIKMEIDVEDADVVATYSQENFTAPAKKFCNRYVGCVVENIVVGPSPEELKRKLESIGEKSINNIVDITNVVMFSVGQPMHAFDRDKLSGSKLFVRSAKEGEQLTTLDNKEVVLNSSHFVIADEKDALAIAGVKGGKKAEVDLNTKNIILESANFNSTTVRKVSRRLNVLTESSKRFENEITPWLADKAMAYAIDLIRKYASNENTKIYKTLDYYPKISGDYKTGFSVSGVNKILGTNYSEQDMLSALGELGFEYEVVENPRAKIIENAKKLIGVPYKYGSSISYDAPNYFDCSTFVSYLHAQVGLSIPRLSIDQLLFGTEVSESEALPGDLIFGNSGEGMVRTESINFLPGTKFDAGVDHVGIYLGDGKVLHSSRYNTSGVETSDISGHKDFAKVVSYRKYFIDENRIAVTIPRTRIDLKNQTDLSEEIGRVLGYENIIDQAVIMNEFKPNIHAGTYINKVIRKELIEKGFSEVSTYSFVKEGEVAPQNPIAQDKAFLRSSLKIGIEESLQKNLINIEWLLLDRVMIFEIGKVFFKEGEKTMLGIGVRNKTGIKKPKSHEIISDAILALKNVLGVEINADIKEGQEFVEIDLEEIYAKSKIGESYPMIDTTQKEYFKTISIYPFMTRDIAVWIPDSENGDELLSIIKNNAGELLIKEPKLFDKFSKEGKTSYAYRLVFQSYEKTLTDEEVNSVMQKINEQIQTKNWQVR